MRRARRLVVAALTVGSIAGLALPAAAPAKGEPMGVRLQSPATGLRAGEPWDLTFTVLAAPAARHWREPAVWLESSGLDPAAFFTARPTGVAGQYRARVTFPSAGRWTYTVGERHGRFFDFGPVTVRAAARKRSALLGATPLAALGVCLALGCAAAVRRRRTAG
jgi:hypothetical protein